MKQAARTLMVVGTASSVGKSLLVAALCRICAQDGWRVAPFKAQNMSLNSFATRDGKEMGRAQAMQAQAAGIEPTVEMNPILLKPEADARSQVVAMGKPWATLKAGDYYQHRDALWPIVTGALDTLRAQYDLVIIEGAGSAVEPNFVSSDIVNMRVARYANAVTLLAGDIDRGGVFGALLGTLDLMSDEERALVKGFIINKFRGDRNLLTPALTFIEQRTNVPVLAVVPHLGTLRIADEDSVALETPIPRPLPPSRQQRGTGEGEQIPSPVPRPKRSRAEPHDQRDGGGLGWGSLIDIAVIRLPHIANFDDFDALALEDNVRVRFVASPADLAQPDAIILPGSKTTIADLEFLNRTGLAMTIAARARRGAKVVGICGGYQMLGRVICDPLHVESEHDAVPGLNLLPVETIFEREKATEQVTARVVADCGFLQSLVGQEIHGYEIHMGRTTGPSTSFGSAQDMGSGRRASPFLQITTRGERTVTDTDGAVDETGHIFGTYLHGLFDNANFRRAWLNSLRPHATSAQSLRD
ncbi:MAG: cobyric acid synthase, partial [Chloroflexota bacterium]